MLWQCKLTMQNFCIYACFQIYNLRSGTNPSLLYLGYNELGLVLFKSE